MLNGRQARWCMTSPFIIVRAVASSRSRLPRGAGGCRGHLRWQVMPSLAISLQTLLRFRAGEQCQVNESLIRVLSLQGTTRSKARSAADDLEPFFEDQVLSDVTQRVSRGSAVGKEKSIILDLIRDAQEFDPQCRRIRSQLRDRIPQDPSLALAPQHEVATLPCRREWSLGGYGPCFCTSARSYSESAVGNVS